MFNTILTRKEQKQEMERLVNNMWAKFYQEAYFDYSKIDYEKFCEIALIIKPAIQRIIDNELGEPDKQGEEALRALKSRIRSFEDLKR